MAQSKTVETAETDLDEEVVDETLDAQRSLFPNALKQTLEAILMASGNAMTEEQMLGCFEEEERPPLGEVRKALNELMNDYTNRGVELKRIASGYRFQVKVEYAPKVSRLWEEKPPRYSRALLETLALIAYRQPITRREIEDIRGVVVNTTIIKTLEEREWIKVVGHRDVPGRPALYATTRAFLDYFSLRTLQELPPLPEVVGVSEALLSAVEVTDLAVTENNHHEAIESSQETPEQIKLEEISLGTERVEALVETELEDNQEEIIIDESTIEKNLFGESTFEESILDLIELERRETVSEEEVVR